MNKHFHYFQIIMSVILLLGMLTACPPEDTPVGALTVTLAPAEAADAGATWQLDGGEARASGATVENLAPGDYTLTFSDVAEWVTPAPQTVSIVADETTTATGTYGKTSFTLSMAVTGEGNVSPPVGSHTYNSGVLAAISAVPAANFAFAGWSGSLESTDASSAVVMDQDRQITANFVRTTYPLAVTISPADGGTVNRQPAGPNYAIGATVTLEAVHAPNFTFAGWSGDLESTDASTTVLMDQERHITATFVRSAYPLAVNVSPAGGGTVNRQPAGPNYAVGATVTLQAVPASNYTFAGWSGDLQGTANPATLVMDAAKTVTANFTTTSEFYDLNVSISGGTEAEVGTVSLSPAGGNYLQGTQVTLTAHPAPYGRFLRWSGDATGSLNPTTITMDSDKSVTAQFAYEPPLFAVQTQAVPPQGGTVQKSPNALQYGLGSTVQLLASAAAGYTFFGWEDGWAGKPNPFELTVTSDHLVRARFDWEVEFPDANLDAVVRETLGVGANAVVLASALDAITALNAANRGISNLEGLQHFRNLTWIDLGGNAFDQLEPLIDNPFIGPGLVVYLDLLPDDAGLCQDSARLRQLGVTMEGADCTIGPPTEFSLHDYLPLNVGNQWGCPSGNNLMALFGSDSSCRGAGGCAPLTVTDAQTINGALTVVVETQGTEFGQPCVSQARLTFTNDWFYLNVDDSELGLLPQVASTAIPACPEIIPGEGTVYTNLGIHYVTLLCEQGALSDFVDMEGAPYGDFEDVLAFRVYVSGIDAGDYIFARDVGPVYFNGFVDDITLP